MLVSAMGEGAVAPNETAAWLLRWCPDRARAFALAMHEIAAWQYDDLRTQHWYYVLKLLPMP